MLDWFRALMPKEDRFFGFFEHHAETLVGGARALTRLLEGGESVPACCGEISRLEEEADQITRDVLLAVRRTFITPFDRSDIQSLVGSLDDAIDQMQKTAKTVALFEVREFRPEMREMGRVIVQAAEIVKETMPLLREVGRHATRLNELTEQVIELEGRADDLQNQGLAALFKSSGSDAMAFLVGMEVYDHLEKVMDRFEDVANRVSAILVEHV